MRYVFNAGLFLFALTLCLSLGALSPHSASAGDSLDGKSFMIKITEHGKEGEKTDDELIFKEGTFFSVDCEQYGFGSAPYESKSKGDTTLFKSTLTSAAEGKSEWEGAVTGDKVKGTFIWSKDGQDPLIYTYEGSLKQ